jgi:hypothetical protein
MRIICEAGNGRVAHDLVGQLQAFLRNNPPPKVQEVPEPEIIVNSMPEDVEIAVEPLVPAHEVANNIFVPNISSNTNTSSGPTIPSFPPSSAGAQSGGGVFVPQY